MQGHIHSQQTLQQAHENGLTLHCHNSLATVQEPINQSINQVTSTYLQLHLAVYLQTRARHQGGLLARPVLLQNRDACVNVLWRTGTPRVLLVQLRRHNQGKAQPTHTHRQ